MCLIHQIVRPYSNQFLNTFDGVVLHFMVLVSVLPLVEFFDSFDSNAVVGIAFILVILPSVSYFAMTVVINKANIKELIINCYYKFSYFHLRQRNYEELPLDDQDVFESSGDTGNGRRINKTICDV